MTAWLRMKELNATMKLDFKSDGSIELYISKEKRELLCNALRYYISHGSEDEYITEKVPMLRRMLRVLELPEYMGKGADERSV